MTVLICQLRHAGQNRITCPTVSSFFVCFVLFVVNFPPANCGPLRSYQVFTRTFTACFVRAEV